MSFKLIIGVFVWVSYPYIDQYFLPLLLNTTSLYMPSLHYSFISYDNINLVQEQGSTQIAMSSTEMQSYINSTFLIRTVLLQLYVSLKLMFPSISAPLIGETTTQIILKQVKFRCNQMLFFLGGRREETWGFKEKPLGAE